MPLFYLFTSCGALVGLDFVVYLVVAPPRACS